MLARSERSFERRKLTGIPAIGAGLGNEATVVVPIACLIVYRYWQGPRHLYRVSLATRHCGIECHAIPVHRIGQQRFC